MNNIKLTFTCIGEKDEIPNGDVVKKGEIVQVDLNESGYFNHNENYKLSEIEKIKV